MLTGATKKVEDLSFENINNLLITSTILMVLSCIMEVLIYFIYDNKVYRRQHRYIHEFLNLYLQFHPRKEIVAEPEEESKKKSDQGTALIG